MRLSTEDPRDEGLARQTLQEALTSGATLLDTAPSYGLDEQDAHHNERLIARTLAEWGGASQVRVATKVGLVRRGKAWRVDGRASAIRRSCEHSRQALGTPRLDLVQLHAPDPKTPWATSVRALAALQAEGLAERVGLCNVSLAELERALELAPIATVQVALGAYDDAAFRGGVVERCFELGIEVLAHTPLGGPKRQRALVRDRELAELAEKYGTSAGSVVLAWLYGLHPLLTPLPGARRPETALRAVRAATLELEAEDRERLDARFSAGARAAGRRQRSVPVRSDAEVVLLVGIQAAGKSQRAADYVARGYERLNRDQLGGSLSQLAKELDRRLRAGGTHFVLDNTYLTRAARDEVVEVADAHGAPTRCVHVDTPLNKAQVNAVLRLLERYGRLPEPEELGTLARKDPNTFAPTVHFRSQRSFEPPTLDKGFAALERVEFAGHDWPHAAQPGLIIALDALSSVAGELGAQPGLIVAPDALASVVDELGAQPVLCFDWAPGHDKPVDTVVVGERTVVVARCVHAEGPPRCWCRPPLPGLIVPWLLREKIEPRRSQLVGTGPAHAALADALDIPYRAALTP